MQRGIGVVLKAHLEETFQAETEDKRLTLDWRGDGGDSRAARSRCVTAS